MGGVRRIRKNMNRSICLVKTGLNFEGSDIMLAVDNPLTGKAVALRFRAYLGYLTSRSSRMNLHDMYSVSAVIHKKLIAGEDISEGLWN